MVTVPVSGMSNVERIRINVDLPEPLAPRIPTISRCLTVSVTLSTARISRFLSFSSSFFLRQRKRGRDFLKTLVTPSMTTASFVVSMVTFSITGVATYVAIENESSFEFASEYYLHLLRSSSIRRFSGGYTELQNRLTPVQLDTNFHAH